MCSYLLPVPGTRPGTDCNTTVPGSPGLGCVVLRDLDCVSNLGWHSQSAIIQYGEGKKY